MRKIIFVLILLPVLGNSQFNTTVVVPSVSQQTVTVGSSGHLTCQTISASEIIVDGTLIVNGSLSCGTLKLNQNSVITINNSANSGCGQIRIEGGNATLNLNTSFFGTGGMEIISSPVPFKFNLTTSNFNCSNLLLNGTSELSLNSNSSLNVSGISTFSNTNSQFNNSKFNTGTINLSAGTLTFSDATINCNGDLNHIGKVEVLNNSILNITNNFTVSGATSTLECSENSIVVCRGNFTNSVGAGCFPSNTFPRFKFQSSAPQYISGINSFYDLYFEGSGFSYLLNGGSTEVKHLLDINNENLQVQTSLTLSNPSSSSLLRTGGMIYVTAISGSKFTRITNSNASYLFPVGYFTSNSQNYRPVVFVPQTSATSNVSIAFVQASLPFPSNQLGNGVYSIHTSFYHQVENSVSGTIKVFHDNVADGEFNTLLSWDGSAWSQASTNLAYVENGDGTMVSSSLVAVSKLIPSASQRAIVLGVGTIISPNDLVKSYALLKKKMDGGFLDLQNKELYFRFEEDYTVGDLTNLEFSIFNNQHNPVSGLASLPVKTGDNRYKVLVSNLSVGYYLLEVKNSKSETWYLRFKVN